MTACPKVDQYSAVSRTTSPVTQVAEVAVNRASRNGAPPGPLVEKGSISSTVPTVISERKPKIMIWAGVILSFFQKGTIFLQSVQNFFLSVPQPAEFYSTRASFSVRRELRWPSSIGRVRSSISKDTSPS